MSHHGLMRIARGIEVNTQKMNAAKTPEEKQKWAGFVQKWKSRLRSKGF